MKIPTSSVKFRGARTPNGDAVAYVMDARISESRESITRFKSGSLKVAGSSRRISKSKNFIRRASFFSSLEKRLASESLLVQESASLERGSDFRIHRTIRIDEMCLRRPFEAQIPCSIEYLVIPVLLCANSVRESSYRRRFHEYGFWRWERRNWL
jgi:hypothetical protein